VLLVASLLMIISVVNIGNTSGEWKFVIRILAGVSF